MPEAEMAHQCSSLNITTMSKGLSPKSMRRGRARTTTMAFTGQPTTARAGPTSRKSPTSAAALGYLWHITRAVSGPPGKEKATTSAAGTRASASSTPRTAETTGRPSGPSPILGAATDPSW